MLPRTPEDICAAVLRAADKANDQIATVHERHACPTCRAAIGEACRHVANGRPLKSAHEARWTLEVPKR